MGGDSIHWDTEATMEMSRRSNATVAMTIILMAGVTTIVGAFANEPGLIFAGPAMIAGVLTWLENGRVRK